MQKRTVHEHDDSFGRGRTSCISFSLSLFDPSRDGDDSTSLHRGAGRIPTIVLRQVRARAMALSILLCQSFRGSRGSEVSFSFLRRTRFDDLVFEIEQKRDKHVSAHHDFDDMTKPEAQRKMPAICRGCGSASFPTA